MDLRELDSELSIYGADIKLQFFTYILTLIVFAMSYFGYSDDHKAFPILMSSIFSIQAAYLVVAEMSFKAEVKKDFLKAKMWFWNWESNGEELYLKVEMFGNFPFGWRLILTNSPVNKDPKNHMIFFFFRSDALKIAKTIQKHYGEYCIIQE